PDANTRNGPPVGFVSRIAARKVSAVDASMSVAFPSEPTEIYNARPSSEKARSLVQCPFDPPGASRERIVSAGPRACRSPFAYAKRTTESAFATYTKSGSGPGG